METEEIIENAKEKYLEYCEQNGFIPTQASNESWVSTRNIVHLVNCNGELARFQLLNGRIYKRE